MITLYHGTDQRIIEMSPEKRAIILRQIDFITKSLRDYFPVRSSFVDYLKKFYSKKLWGRTLTEEDINILNYNLSEALLRFDANKEGNPKFQYGHLYLTSNRMKAADYARGSFAYGEIGRTAFSLIQNAVLLGIEIGPLSIEVYASKFLEFALGEAQPVIYEIKCDESLLTSEEGTPLIYFDGEILNDCFRYNGVVDWSIDEVEYTALEDWKI